jgi:hypothetical protein
MSIHGWCRVERKLNSAKQQASVEAHDDRVKPTRGAALLTDSTEKDAVNIVERNIE